MFEGIKKLFRINKRSAESISLSDERLLNLLGIDIGEINVKGTNALKEATVYACVRIKSDAVSKLPLKIYDNHNKAVNHPLYNLLKLRPNPFMSSNDFWKCIEGYRNIKGNAYAYIDCNRKGRIMGLYPLIPDQVKIYVDNEGLFNHNNKIWYVITLKNNKKIKLQHDEILHFKDFTLDGIAGISPLDYLNSLIENGKASQEYINKFFKNGLSIKGIIQYIGDLDLKAKKMFIQEFEEMSSGLDNAHSVSLLPIGYQFQPISLSMADAQFLENAQLTIRQIAAAFGVKMHQINDLSRATYSNVAEQQKEFYIDTLQSILTMYEQELTYKLFLDREIEQGYHAKFNVDSILRSDIKTRYEAYRIGIQGGFLSSNEVRAKEDLEPKDGGDDLLINGNMMPITMAGKQYLKGGDTGV